MKAKIKGVIKSIIFFISTLITLPLSVPSIIESKISNKETFFCFGSHILSLAPGLLGNYLRKGYYYLTLESCSSSVDINFGSFFSHRQAKVEDSVCIGAYCIIGCVNIKKGTLIGSRVSILSGKNQHEYINGKITRQALLSTVSIGENTWIGEGSLVLNDVGNNTIISAGSIVFNKIPDNMVFFPTGSNKGKLFKRVTIENLKKKNRNLQQ